MTSSLLPYLVKSTSYGKAAAFTFAGSLQVSLQTAGGAGVLRAAESSSWAAGGARELQDAVLVVVTAAARHGAARHLPAGRFAAETSVIAWEAGAGGRAERQGLPGLNHQQMVEDGKPPLLQSVLTIFTFQAGEPAFGQRRQAETLQVELPIAVAFAHHQALAVHLADLRKAHTGGGGVENSGSAPTRREGKVITRH